MKKRYIINNFRNNHNWLELQDNVSDTLFEKCMFDIFSGYIIKYIKNPSEEIQIEAVRKNGYAIRFIKNPSEEIQIEAVKENGYAIEYIKNPTEKVQELAYGVKRQ